MDGSWTTQEEVRLEDSFHHVSVKALARKLGSLPTAIKLTQRAHGREAAALARGVHSRARAQRSFRPW
jgi:hypothetical protein